MSGYFSITNPPRACRGTSTIDEALATLGHIDTGKLRGTWRNATLLSLGEHWKPWVGRQE